jgi:hypothetical protein
MAPVTAFVGYFCKTFTKRSFFFCFGWLSISDGDYLKLCGF